MWSLKKNPELPIPTRLSALVLLNESERKRFERAVESELEKQDKTYESLSLSWCGKRWPVRRKHWR